ncbi:raffinose/stachyose/melibiose transport system substrate-binding protein [Anaerocolumna jejuensis DSM 15929]|uniref:Raffinose/stachyose/melibiose transport system substrate-binding protein n=1 Tax=Anaerocolumna jejuensis DSM 15929 TaxID=1121322 RepID=A0A1M6MPJ4_9FIRM|nr:extracellular solute-binding protein [Anaerocolumna jejuensis]SHJ85326.1 raffinose/stachyose/melibiose transport system substrate-binding protein [Anaerocolumna jejuensis DSM 15929]
MKKRLFAVLLSAVLTAASLTGCASSNAPADNAGSANTNNSSTAEKDKKDDTSKGTGKPIRLVNGKIEIDNQLKAFATAYKERTGQEVIIESLGGGADINGTLKGYLATDNMPDIFVFGGEGDYQTWKDYMADLSSENWASQTDFGFKDGNGKTVGFPYAVEGYGITYNADILKKAGVDPKSLVNFDAYKAAFEKIDSMKDELGITAVCSVAAEAGQMYWSTANHIFGYYLSAGLKRDDTTYIDMLKEGKVDEQRLGQFADFTKMLFSYSDQKVLISGTYDDQLALWAQGKAAFITQGNWIDPSLPSYNATFDCGIAPLAFLKEDTSGILADCPSWWAVYGDGKNIDACKAFLNDLATSAEGQKALVKDCGMISPYKTCKEVPETPLAVSLKSYIDAGNTYAWQWAKMPEGIATNATGAVFELYAKGDIDKDGFVKMLGKAIADYVKK